MKNEDEIKDGGAAFPTTAEAQNGYAETGMTLRDWFATHASEEDINEFIPKTVGDVEHLCKHLGIDATNVRISVKNLRYWARYQHADAMLVARNKK